MPEVARNVDIVAAKLKSLKEEIKANEAELRALDKALQVDPGNVDLVNQKYKLLEQQLILNKDKSQAFQEQINTLNIKLDSGAISQESYEKSLKKVEQQSRLTEIEITKLTASVEQQNAVVEESGLDDFSDSIKDAKSDITDLTDTEKKATFSTMTKGLRDAKKEVANLMSAVGLLSGALTSGLNLINKWGEMSFLEKVLGTLSVAATVAAIAMTMFHASWSLRLAVGAITAAVIAGVAVIKNASKDVGIDVGDEVDGATGDMQSTATTISTSKKEIDINVKLDTTGDTLLDQSNAYMMGGIIVDKLKKELLGTINSEMGGIVRT